MSETIPMKQTICLDFDGVLHAYSKGWHDGTIYDGVVPGALEALRALEDSGYRLVVSTCRVDLDAVEFWLHRQFGAMGDRMEVTNQKPLAVAYVDDRGVRFTGSWPDALADLNKALTPVAPITEDTVVQAVRDGLRDAEIDEPLSVERAVEEFENARHAWGTRAREVYPSVKGKDGLTRRARMECAIEPELHARLHEAEKQLGMARARAEEEATVAANRIAAAHERAATLGLGAPQDDTPVWC